MKRARVLLILLVLALVSGLTLAQDDERILVIGHAEATDSLDPALGYNQTTDLIRKATYDTLVTFPDTDATEILPLLATDWTVSEDGLTYTFNLRDDVVFSNGDPLTAEDVVFSINRLKNLQGNPSFLAANIASVVADDDHTVTFTLTGVDPSFLSKLTSTVFAVTNADQIRAEGGTDAPDAAETDTAEAYLNNNSAGTGPYILVSWEPQVETVLVRNDNYWGEPAYFDRIIIQNIPEAATQKVALEAGDIDLALDLTADQIVELEGNPDVTIYTAPGNIVHFLLINRDEELCGPTANPLVAKAIRLALDYEGYIALWGGVTPAAPTGIALFTGYGSENASQRDVERARELLAEAGYPDGFEVTLDYPTFTFQGVNMETNVQKIVDDLADVGIVVTPRGGDIQVQLEGYRGGRNCLGYWFWGPDILDPVDAVSFLPCGGEQITDGVRTCAVGKVGGERANWTEANADPEIIELRDRALSEVDPEARAEIYRQIYDYLQENGPWAPFLQPNVQAAYRSDIQGYAWHPQWTMDPALISRVE